MHHQHRRIQKLGQTPSPSPDIQSFCQGASVDTLHGKLSILNNPTATIS
jgi:hypothetical protein